MRHLLLLCVGGREHINHVKDEAAGRHEVAILDGQRDPLVPPGLRVRGAVTDGRVTRRRPDQDTSITQ